MTTPSRGTTLEDFARTIANALEFHDWASLPNTESDCVSGGTVFCKQDFLIAARAVIETHFVPIWAAAYRQGERSAEGAEECEVHAASEKEADRIKRLILEPREMSAGEKRG